MKAEADEIGDDALVAAAECTVRDRYDVSECVCVCVCVVGSLIIILMSGVAKAAQCNRAVEKQG